MVNFDNETTITRPRTDLLHFMILEARYNLIMQIRKHYHSVDKFNKSNLSEVKASLIELFIYLFRSMNKSEKEVSEIISLIKSLKKMESLLKYVCEFETFMYDKKITMFDNYKVSDPSNPETENIAAGLD